MAKELSEKDLKRPDEFETIFGRLLQKMIDGRKAVAAVLVAVLIGSLGFLFWRGLMEKKNLKAADRFAKIFENDSADRGTPAAREKFLKDLEDFIREYGSSSLAPSARLYHAKGLMESEKYTEALSEYKDLASALSKPYAYLAMEGEGLALMELKRWSEAEAVWADLYKRKDNPARAFHAWNLGLTQESGNRTSQAVQTYQEFETQFVDSPFLERVQMRLSALRKGSS